MKTILKADNFYLNRFFTLRVGLMRPFGALSEDRGMLIQLHLGCLPNKRIKPVRNTGDNRVTILLLPKLSDF